MESNLTEAERRIEEARRSRAKILDLGDFSLAELPESLGRLVQLKALYLGMKMPTKVGDTVVLRRMPPQLTDLSVMLGLQGLQILNLACCVSLRDLSPLSRLQSLRSLDLQLCPKVTDLSPLFGLPVLQILSLKSTGVTNLSPLSGLEGLQSLELGSTCVTDLSPLSGLQGLQVLDLDSAGGVTDLSPLSSLKGLLHLTLRSTGVIDLSPLSGLKGLQGLDLGWTSVTDLSPLSGLKGLQILNFRSTGVTDLSPLSGLKELQRLDFSSTGVTDLSPLSGLKGLQGLDFSSTGVTDLSRLSGLKGLQSLDFSRTGVMDLSPLSDLRGLQSLDFRSTGVTDLSPLAGLKGLQSLDFSSTGVTDLSPLADLQGLQSLNLCFCRGVTDLSPLSILQQLRMLYLYACGSSLSADFLRFLVDHPRLTWLSADKAVGVPQEVLSRSHYDDNCLPRLWAHYAELDLASEVENEVKVILLGNGRVGKTQLCRRFRGEPFDESVESTHGVQIWRDELRIWTRDQDQVFQVNWWDFGGQDIYHGTHALFLRSRAVFLILWTPKLENRDEYEENGIPLRNQPLAYWLDYVRNLAGADSPVLVVQSQCDRFADQHPAPPRPDGFGFFQGCAYSAKTDLGRDPLEAQLREAIRYLLDRNGQLQIGRGCAEVRRQLYEWRSEDQERKPGQREHRTLTLEGFRALCDKAGDVASWEHVLDYLHQTGVVFYDPKLFFNRIVLDQDWALDAVYTVFYRGRVSPWLRDSGRFTREDLALMVWREHSVDEQGLFLSLMESCGVCFRCGETAQGEARYIAPDLLPGFEAVRGRLYAWKDEPGTPTLRLEYRFFHPAIIRGLMKEIGKQAGDLAEYWKYGLWLMDGKRETQLLVQFEDTSMGEAPGAGVLELKAQGRDALGLLCEIRGSILQQRIGEEPEERLTLDGVTVARSALANLLYDGRALDIQRNPVPAATFAAFFEDRDDHPAEADAKIDIQPQALTSEKPCELFISYAWGDGTPAGKIRAEVVDALYAALDKDGFQPVRDRNEMRSGDQISIFIRRLTRADLVVAVISDKYLRSSYCMHEIHGLWQKSQEDADLMAERLVPIVLPEVRIEGLTDRASYVRYWKAKSKELEELYSELGTDLSPESLRELRLVRSFAQDVDGILLFLQDILMPRNLEVHLEDGFQAVREALRRRIFQERPLSAR